MQILQLKFWFLIFWKIGYHTYKAACLGNFVYYYAILCNNLSDHGHSSYLILKSALVAMLLIIYKFVAFDI